MKYANYSKAQLIETIECLEHNIHSLRKTLEQQYQNVLEQLVKEKQQLINIIIQEQVIKPVTMTVCNVCGKNLLEGGVDGE